MEISFRPRHSSGYALGVTEPHLENAAGREAILEAIFGEMIQQLTDMAITLTGRLPMPDGERIQDLESAKKVIDQLDALEYMTRGNLGSKQAPLLAEYLSRAKQEFALAMEAQSSD